VHEAGPGVLAHVVQALLRDAVQHVGQGHWIARSYVSVAEMTVFLKHVLVHSSH
jgi:hypothetical protein